MVDDFDCYLKCEPLSPGFLGPRRSDMPPPRLGRVHSSSDGGKIGPRKSRGSTSDTPG